MKTHTTIKAIRQNWNNVYRCGYCDLQYIMRYEEPNYYNSGVYGWNCDVYCDFKRDIAITTGYRNMTGRVIPNEIIERYSNIAKEICKNTWSKAYDEIKAELDQNRENFFNELVNVC
jgi:virulence-associated protein VapD